MYAQLECRAFELSPISIRIHPKWVTRQSAVKGWEGDSKTFYPCRPAAWVGNLRACCRRIRQLFGKSPSMLPQNTSVIWHLWLAPTVSTHLSPCFSIVQDEHRTSLMSVWPQLRTNSGWTSSIVTTVVISARNASFSLLKFSAVCLLLEVFALLYTNFICFRRECAQCLFSCIGPKNSASITHCTSSECP